MEKVILGRTGICVQKNGFGALPVQRVSLNEAKIILRKAYENGIRFFDSARAYSDSEEKIGLALSDVRENIYISTKTMATTVQAFWEDLETSLKMLKTDYIDIYQFHNPSFCPKPGDGTGLYEAMLEAKSQGKIHYIGLTNHGWKVAKEAIESDLYDSVGYYTYSKPIEFSFKLCGGDVNEILADFDLLSIVLQNFLSNAIDAIEEGECEAGQVNITFSDESDFWCFSISDNGVGIQDKNILFEPFKTTKLKGNGLGLALCQQIVAAHNGSIELQDSQTKKTFFVKIAKN